jgi:uncharacterized cupin superfamily protein
MPKIDIASVKIEIGTHYPDPYHIPVARRARQRLGNAVGLDQFGVNLTRLPPGTQSSQRHWHQSEDELVYVLEGELVLLENDGETVLKAGDAAGWKAGTDNGHCLINRSQRDALYLEVGTRKVHDRVVYPDIDLLSIKDEKGQRFANRSGELYPPRT